VIPTVTGGNPWPAIAEEQRRLLLKLKHYIGTPHYGDLVSCRTQCVLLHGQFSATSCHMSHLVFHEAQFSVGRGYFAEYRLRNAKSCHGVICGKIKCGTFRILPLIYIPQPKNSALPRIANLLFARIVQQIATDA